MPNCKKCNNYFPVRIKIDNKIKILSNRKYCLDCSPFGKHNTKKLEVEKTENCICKICNKHYIYNRTKGHKKDKCNSCSANAQRRAKKQKCVDYKGGQCIICKYDKCNRALTFHHMDESKKDFAINSAMSMGWDKIKNELDKCVLLCNRCHMEIHENLIKIPPIA